MTQEPGSSPCGTSGSTSPSRVPALVRRCRTSPQYHPTFPELQGRFSPTQRHREKRAENASGVMHLKKGRHGRSSWLQVSSSVAHPLPGFFQETSRWGCFLFVRLNFCTECPFCSSSTLSASTNLVFKLLLFVCSFLRRCVLLHNCCTCPLLPIAFIPRSVCSPGIRSFHHPLGAVPSLDGIIINNNNNTRLRSSVRTVFRHPLPEPRRIYQTLFPAWTIPTGPRGNADSDQPNNY